MNGGRAEISAGLHSKSARGTLFFMTRIWRVALLSLLIALLPLRGWAWAVMPVAVPTAPVLAAEAGLEIDAAHQAQASEMPCHGHAASPSESAQPSSGPTKVAHTCSLCDLCHAGVIAPPTWSWAPDAPPLAAPSWAVTATPGRDGQDSLFRPPRA